MVRPVSEAIILDPTDCFGLREEVNGSFLVSGDLAFTMAIISESQTSLSSASKCIKIGALNNLCASISFSGRFFFDLSCFCSKYVDIPLRYRSSYRPQIRDNSEICSNFRFKMELF